MINIASARIKPLAKGILSYVIPKKILSNHGTGGTSKASYCYSVWLRHLTQLYQSGIITSLERINKVAEIGPGDSLGIGMSAIFSGIDEYYALDIIEYANHLNNALIAEELSNYFLERKNIPNGENFRNVRPQLADYSFPEKIIDKLHEQEIQNRLANIKKTLLSKKTEKDPDNPIIIEYVVPWIDDKKIKLQEFDLIFSQAVMEHVEDIQAAYNTMYNWLKPGGIISHQIDFRAHEIASQWYDHWYIDNFTWNVIMHGRSYLINRIPLSQHVKAIKKAGFNIKNVVPVKKENPKSLKDIRVNIPFDEDDLVSIERSKDDEQEAYRFNL